MKIFMLIMFAFRVIYCDWSQEPKEVNYIYQRSECIRFNPKFVEKLNCSHTFATNFSKYSSLELVFHPGVILDNVYLELTTYKKFRTIYRPTLIKIKENFCDMVGNRSNSYFAKEVRNVLGSYITNLNEPCPLKGIKFKRDNLNYTEITEPASHSLPPLIPLGDWKFVYQWSTLMNGPEEFIVELADVFEVRQKSATQF